MLPLSRHPWLVAAPLRAPDAFAPAVVAVQRLLFLQSAHALQARDDSSLLRLLEEDAAPVWAALHWSWTRGAAVHNPYAPGRLRLPQPVALALGDRQPHRLPVAALERAMGHARALAAQYKQRAEPTGGDGGGGGGGGGDARGEREVEPSPQWDAPSADQPHWWALGALCAATRGVGAVRLVGPLQRLALGTASRRGRKRLAADDGTGAGEGGGTPQQALSAQSNRAQASAATPVGREGPAAEGGDDEAGADAPPPAASLAEFAPVRLEAASLPSVPADESGLCPLARAARATPFAPMGTVVARASETGGRAGEPAQVQDTDGHEDRAGHLMSQWLSGAGWSGATGEWTPREGWVPHALDPSHGEAVAALFNGVGSGLSSGGEEEDIEVEMVPEDAPRAAAAAAQGAAASTVPVQEGVGGEEEVARLVAEAGERGVTLPELLQRLHGPGAEWATANGATTPEAAAILAFLRRLVSVGRVAPVAAGGAFARWVPCTGGKSPWLEKGHRALVGKRRRPRADDSRDTVWVPLSPLTDEAGTLRVDALTHLVQRAAGRILAMPGISMVRRAAAAAAAFPCSGLTLPPCVPPATTASGAPRPAARPGGDAVPLPPRDGDRAGGGCPPRDSGGAG